MASEGKGLRIDANVTFPDGKMIWGDVTSIHSTSASSRSSNLNWLKHERKAHIQQRIDGTPNPFKAEPSKAVEKASNHKYQKYAPMIQLACSQVDEGSRKVRPQFGAWVMTHRGEMGPDLIKFVELLAVTLKSKALRGEIPQSILMGTKPSVFSAMFRTRCKDRLMATMVRGWGRQLRAVGFPRA